MMVAHGNILSYYDVDKEEWKCHHKFEENSQQASDKGLGQVNMNQTFCYMIKKKVLCVFRHEY